MRITAITTAAFLAVAVPCMGRLSGKDVLDTKSTPADAATGNKNNRDLQGQPKLKLTVTGTSEATESSFNPDATNARSFALNAIKFDDDEVTGRYTDVYTDNRLVKGSVDCVEYGEIPGGDDGAKCAAVFVTLDEPFVESSGALSPYFFAVACEEDPPALFATRVGQVGFNIINCDIIKAAADAGIIGSLQNDPTLTFTTLEKFSVKIEVNE